jgi:hypothetical protein
MRRADLRAESTSPAPTKAEIRDANAELARKLCEAHAPQVGRAGWETALVHAASAHREMAAMLRWKRNPRG